MTSDTGPDPQKAFHDRISARNLAALWVARRGVDITKPKSPAQATLWRYGDIRPEITVAGEIVSAEDAFRRVLVLENPAFPGEMRITNTLYAGLQLVRPGEIAPCHRHSQTALRFVVEGDGAYTTVEGERVRLSQGDFVITRNWSWHDHGNDSDNDVVWLDGLDTPLVDFLDTVFRDFYPENAHPLVRPEGDAAARYGAGMMPMGFEAENIYSPVLRYPYAPAREALDKMRRSETGWDDCHGLKMRYINPASGGDAMPTMAAFLQFLPKEFNGAPYRATDGAVFCVTEGAGRCFVDGKIIEWGPRDVFVVPGWHEYHLEADSDAVLFSFSDQPVQQKLGLWREERSA
jgi:gentisate 1,2-dioxygenase